MTWFSGHGSFGAAAEDLREFFGCDYIDVSNYDVFVSNGITDPESMRNYLRTIFTERMQGKNIPNKKGIVTGKSSAGNAFLVCYSAKAYTMPVSG